jgi:uncharacterized phiE125 gp8 family phage protein
MTVFDPIEPDGVTVVKAPTAEPVTRGELKAYLRVGSTHENDLIDSYGVAAREHIERWTGRAMMPQTLRLSLQSFPSKEIELPRSPISSSSSEYTVRYFESGSTAVVVSSTVYFVDHTHEPGRIVLERDQSWPSTVVLRARNGVEVDFVAGYTGGSTAVPAGLKTAIKSLTANWYENREPVIIGTIGLKIPLTLESLLESFTVKRFA